MLRRHDDNELHSVRLPWGDVLLTRNGEAIGRSLLTLGVHELAVSEVLWRLADAGEICLDVGANLGYMTSLLATRVGPGGEVFSFEPHPQVFSSLKRNTAKLSSNGRVTLHNDAIGDADGVVDLVEPANFKANEGSASLALAAASEFPVQGARYEVTLRRLDSIFSSGESFGVMKVDVEGAEMDVFRGADGLLTEHKIRDIVWEDHHLFPSESIQLLSRHGYRIYQFSKRLFGPCIWDPSAVHSAGLPWETVNYVATLDSNRVQNRLKARGWRCLRGNA